MQHFGKLMFTPSVKSVQAENGSQASYESILERPAPEGLGPNERLFIETRSSFYMATSNPDGWPYVQHRGGPAGFLKVLSNTQIAFADYKGNRQYVSTGNLVDDNRVSLFLMDYPRKARLKLLGNATISEPQDTLPRPNGVPVERTITIDLVAFDWNCPKYIEERFTMDEIAEMVGPKFAELEAKNAQLEARLASFDPDGK